MFEGAYEDNNGSNKMSTAARAHHDVTCLTALM